MYSNTSNLPYIRNFAEAEAYWKRTAKPPRSKKWAEHQRPLKDGRAWHYRIEKSLDGDSYDLYLYHTLMARFHRPDSGGMELRQYVGHASQTSKTFMSNVLGVSYFSHRTAKDGRTVFMPVPTVEMKNSIFSCNAWFTADNRLDIAASEHTPLFKQVSADDDKHLRKMIKSEFEPLLTLCAMRVPEWETTEVADYMRSGDFVSAGLKYNHKNAIAKVVRAFEMGDEPEQEHVEWIMETARVCYIKLVSNRAQDQRLISWANQTCSPREIEKRVTEKDLVQSLWTTIKTHGHLKLRSGRVEYPQFPEPDQVTLSNVFARSK